MNTRDPEFRSALEAHLARFQGADDARALRELLETVAVYGLALAVIPPAFHAARASASWAGGAAWGALCAVSVLVLAGALVRAFLVHHDLAHGSFFSSPRYNRAVAPLVGALASTSPSVWQREHARHHRDSNNLDRSQDGQTAPWTLAQYEAAPAWQRWAYWVVHQPPVLYGLVPPLYFFGFMRVRARWYENAAFFAFLGLLIWTGRLGAFAAAMFPAMAFGFLVFHAQHTFEGLVRWRQEDYDFVENGLRGSTLLVVPHWPLVGPVLRWCLYGVEYHHVHHLRPGLPAWKLRAIHEEGGALFDATPRVTLLDAVKATRLSLYDERAGRLVTFASRPPWRVQAA